MAEEFHMISRASSWLVTQLKVPWWHWVFLAFQVASLLWAWHWFGWERLPFPGYAVAYVAVLAAAMSLEPDMRGWQKALWMIVIALFLKIEFRAVSKDHYEAHWEAVSAQKTEAARFQGVLVNENARFTATAQDLQKAIGGIDKTLVTSNATLLQTRPQAALRIANVTLDPYFTLVAGVPSKYNFYYFNGGQATAQRVAWLSEVYVGKPLHNKMDNPEDIAEQQRLMDRFETSWKTDANKYIKQVTPALSGFQSGTVEYTQDEINELRQGIDTIYFLSRVEYSDSTGRWRTDFCQFLQVRNDVIDVVPVSCGLFTRDRYAAPTR